MNYVKMGKYTKNVVLSHIRTVQAGIIWTKRGSVDRWLNVIIIILNIICRWILRNYIFFSRTVGVKEMYIHMIYSCF